MANDYNNEIVETIVGWAFECDDDGEYSASLTAEEIGYAARSGGVDIDVLIREHLEPCADAPVMVVRVRGWRGHVVEFLEGHDFPSFGCHTPDANGNLRERDSF